MKKDKKAEGCVATAAGPAVSESASEHEDGGRAREEKTMRVTVGREAPDFEASAFYQNGFKNIRLSEFRGKWVFLCFYPGDFTFV